MSTQTGFSFFPQVLTDPGQLRQNIYTESSTQKHAIGTQFREFRGGQTRLFRYIKAGAVNLSPGLLMQASAPIANHTNIAVGGAVSAGEVDIPIATTLSTTTSANQYDNGFFHINDATGEGQGYPVKSHTVSTTPTITLYDPIAVALATGSEFTLSANPYKDIIVAPTTLTACPVGVTLVSMTAAYYGWICTGGDIPALVDTAETLVIGEAVGYPATISVAGAVGVAAVTDPIIGFVRSVNAASEYACIRLVNLDI